MPFAISFICIKRKPAHGHTRKAQNTTIPRKWFTGLRPHKLFHNSIPKSVPIGYNPYLPHVNPLKCLRARKYTTAYSNLYQLCINISKTIPPQTRTLGLNSTTNRPLPAVPCIRTNQSNPDPSGRL